MSPKEPLTPPKESLSEEDKEEQMEITIQTESSAWLVVAKNKRVNRDWEAVLLRAPNNARRCYEDLCFSPMERKQGRVFPLKGKLYQGAWEYEVTSCDRVFYIPDPEKQKVLVYYAGSHIKPTPIPPSN